MLSRVNGSGLSSPSPIKRDVSVILLGVAILVPGVVGNYLLSDDFPLLETWGGSPLLQWFCKESAGYYRPLTALLFHVEWDLWQTTTTGYYVTGLLLHAAATLLVYDIARRVLPEGQRTGLGAACLFLFQAGHAFTVLWVSAQTDLLASVFYLAAVALYLRSRTGQAVPLLLSLLAFVLSLLAKEMAVSLPLLILAWEAMLSLQGRRFSASRCARRALPYVSVLLAYMAARYVAFGHLPTSPYHANLAPTHLINTLARYTATVFSPWGLEALKPFFRSQPAFMLVLSGTVAILGALVAYRLRKRLQTWHLMCLTFCLITLLPVLRLFSPWTAYLPCAGAAMLISGVLRAIPEGTTRAHIGSAALASLILLNLLYTMSLQGQWRHASSICRSILNELTAAAPLYPNGLNLANLVVEVGEAPVFGSPWAFSSALRVRGIPIGVNPLASVRQETAATGLSVIVTGSRSFRLALTGKDDFFRLGIPEIISGRREPAIGQTANRSTARITVTGLGRHRRASEVDVVLASNVEMDRTVVWRDGKLQPLKQN